MAYYKHDRGDFGWRDRHLFATVHRLLKVAAEKGRRVGLKGKKEGRQKGRNSKEELINASSKSNVKA